MLVPEAPSSELGRQASCQSLDMQNNSPARSSCLGPDSEGSRDWAGPGLGMQGPGCLRPLGVRNVLPGGAVKGPHLTPQLRLHPGEQFLRAGVQLLYAGQGGQL